MTLRVRGSMLIVCPHACEHGCLTHSLRWLALCGAGRLMEGGRRLAISTPPTPVPPRPPAATGKKKARKTAGGGGVLGKLGLKKGGEERAEEEPPGAGTAASPRYIQVR